MIKMPYTNLHELNLDWIIEQLGKDGPVFSVNEKTGIVTLTGDDIARSSGNSETISTALTTQGQSVQTVRTQIGVTPLPTVAQTLTGAIAENAQEIADIGDNVIGNTALPTTAQTLTGAIAENSQEIADVEDNVIGNTALPTTAQTLTGAIAELNNRLAYIALTVTKGAGASDIAINARKFGRLCIVSGTIDFAAAPSSWTNYDIATITYGDEAITSTIYVTGLVYGNSGKIATIEIEAGTNKLVFRPLGNTDYTDVTGRFSLIYPTSY